MSYWRYAIGRWLIHLGLRTMPLGPVRAMIAEKLMEVRFEVEAALRDSTG